MGFVRITADSSSSGVLVPRLSLFGGGLRFDAPFSEKVENHPSMGHPYKGWARNGRTEPFGCNMCVCPLIMF